MKRFLVVLAAFVMLTSLALAGSHSGNSDFEPIIQDTGGPDAYGYSWEDNDGGGSPVYNWIDITTFGTEVNGLIDDNYVGPFSLGFEFPYYWYTVNRLWIGSNGYIMFSSPANFAHPFASIPATTPPNDLIAVLAGDLDFTEPGGSCYYYSNGSDSFIVSWIDVPEFSNDHSLVDSTHTLQLILTANDSTITFQYAENHGNFAEGGNLADVIGIENVNGQVGLEYLEDNTPVGHMWHSGLALKFHPVPDPNYVVHDFGMLNGMNETSGAEFRVVNQQYVIRAQVKNFGNQPETNVKVRVQVRRGTTTILTDTVDVASIQPAEILWVDFLDNFTPTVAGVYRFTFSTIMTGDANPGNNSMTTELDVYQLPQELKYCDDLPDGDGRSWNGDYSGFGCEFEMPEAINVIGGSFYVMAVAANGPAYIFILPDSAGNPLENSPLAVDTVQVTAAGWVNIDYSSNNLLFDANEKFYMVVLHALQNTFTFAMDQTVPLSNRGWEYTGGLAPDRDRSLSDVMIKVNATSANAIGDDANLPQSFSVSQNYPNPFNAKTNINFTLERESDVSFKIFNLTGQLVDDLSGHFLSGNNSITWDAAKVASGVYFYKVEVDNQSEVRRMVLLK